MPTNSHSEETSKITVDEELKNLSDQPVNLHNLTPFCRVERVLKSKDANLKTNRELRERAKVKRYTFQRSKNLFQYADEETLKKLREDKVSINEAYTQLHPEIKQPPKKTDKESLTTCLKKLLDMRRRMLKAKYDFEKANHFFSILPEFGKLLTEFAKMLEQPPDQVFSGGKRHHANIMIGSLATQLKRWQTAIEGFQQKMHDIETNESTPKPNSPSNVPLITPIGSTPNKAEVVSLSTPLTKPKSE